MAGNDANIEPQKGKEDVVAYQTTNIYSDWQVNGNNFTNTSPMVDSFCPPIWGPSLNAQNLGYCDVNVRNVAGTSSNLGPVRGGMDWSTSNAILRGGMFVPSVQGMVPSNMPHFPADSGFIERAARFSCFGGGNFGEVMNPFNLPDPYSQNLGPIQGPQNVLGGNGSKSLETNVTSVSKEVSLTEGSPFENVKKIESYVNSRDEAKHGVNTSGNESNEAEFSGRGGQEESSRKATGSKKRRRTGKDTNEHNENNEAPQPSTEEAKGVSEVKQKDNQNPTSIKPGGKNGQEGGSQGSDLPKEEYIHMRARRGQATNSHSLAERVRREKISERMKFLQDLVPGCSKVTGKAVMLDEIINYVQSLQRQVEFLSMKLATVDPPLDFNIEGRLAKDILQPRAGVSSSLPFHAHDMTTTVPFPPLPHPSQLQPGLMQAGLPGWGNSSEALRRLINFQPSAGFKEHTSQVRSAWEDDLHNIIHMGLNANAALSNSQDLSASLQPRHTKDES